MADLLYTIDQGSGPPVLLVHGFPLSHSMWDSQLDSLSKHHRVIAPDLRGFGQSTDHSVDFQTAITMDDFADDLILLLDHLEINEPITFVGLSMGGYIAWRFFQRHRSRLRSLVLCDTKAADDTTQARSIRYRMAEGIRDWGSAHVAKLMTAKIFSSQTHNDNESVVKQMSEIIATTKPETIAAAQRGMAERMNANSLLPSIDIPTLYVCGSEDQLSPPEEMRSMAEATPGAHYFEIDRAGHMSPLEKPDQFNPAILSFLAKN